MAAGDRLAGARFYPASTSYGLSDRNEPVDPIGVKPQEYHPLLSHARKSKITA